MTKKLVHYGHYGFYYLNLGMSILGYNHIELFSFLPPKIPVNSLQHSLVVVLCKYSAYLKLNLHRCGNLSWVGLIPELAPGLQLCKYQTEHREIIGLTEDQVRAAEDI